jgi:predicted dehydrogenase
LIKVGVIGYGHWGPNHVRTFNSLPDSEVVAVADLDKQRLRSVREAYPWTRCEQDYRRILDDPAIDAVVVATPIGTHYKIVREALLVNKHVLCEKPLCKSSPEQAIAC